MVQQELPLRQGGASRKVKPPAWKLILEYLSLQSQPIAIHDFNIHGVSQNSIGSRLPELALRGKVHGGFYNGEPFKRWKLVQGGDINGREQEDGQTGNSGNSGNSGGQEEAARAERYASENPAGEGHGSGG